MTDDPKALLRRLFQAAVAAADPAHCLAAHLPAPPKGRTVVIGAGKAAASMALAVEQSWPGPLSGLVITRYGHGLPCEQIEVVEAGHPMPDDAGLQAARRMRDMVAELGEDDLALCLISGGGSALLALPADGLTLADKQAVTRELLRCGATISEMNCLRKRLSGIKGGRLAAAAAPARVVSLLISDVPGDDPAIIASGPTVPDHTTSAEARAILDKYAIQVPEHVRAHLASPGAETPAPGHPDLARVEAIVIAKPQDSLEAAAAEARRAGYTPCILSDSMEGESRDIAHAHAAIARQVAGHGQPVAAPTILLSGGETTVTLRGQGRGGRNAEFLLALAVDLEGAPGIHAIACDTDGIDGSEDNAGATLSPDSLARAEALGVSARERLADNDGYGFFSALGDLIVTGPTRTNVNDFRAILIEE